MSINDNLRHHHNPLGFFVWDGLDWLRHWRDQVAIHSLPYVDSIYSISDHIVWVECFYSSHTATEYLLIFKADTPSLTRSFSLYSHDGNRSYLLIYSLINFRVKYLFLPSVVGWLSTRRQPTQNRWLSPATTRVCLASAGARRYGDYYTRKQNLVSYWSKLPLKCLHHIGIRKMNTISIGDHICTGPMYS